MRDEQTRQLLNRALEATEVGASFNRKLLSLVRKRQLEMTRVSLNERVADMSNLLARTLWAIVVVPLRSAIEVPRHD